VTTDLFSVAGRRVVVTGGSHGIGAMIAGGFVDAGARVVVCGRDADAIRMRAKELSGRGAGECVAEVADVATEEGCRALADLVAGHFDALDVLVNNAGGASMAPFEEFDEAQWESVLAVNLKAVSHLTRMLLPQLRAAASGGAPARVINIGSISGERVGELDNYAYVASKAAVHHFSRHLARRLAPAVTVNAIAPGPFESRMMAPILERHADAIAKTVPLQRIGTPDDVAAAAIYLASPAAAWVTGTVLTVDGGVSLT
jgi:NAD(P)-dependent dehydrogenase (short-subunit alcohol dehydrogenase family)